MGCCYSCCCCPKASSQNNNNRKSRKKHKEYEKIESNNGLGTNNWKDDNIQNIRPENIKDSELTEEIKIPSDKYKDTESFLKARGCLRR